MKIFHAKTTLRRVAVLLGACLVALSAEAQTKAKSKFTVSGYVTDRNSSETLIGANVLESRSQQGTATNAYGHYSITLPAGEVSLRFSYLGYHTVSHSFSLSNDTTLNIGMSDANLLQEVVIVSDKKETGNLATGMGAMEIPIAQIKQTPNMLGEADVMKVIQLMPGVQPGTDGTAGLHVRGGGPDQNLILLDGVPVYNIDHLFGFFSVFTPEAVKKVTLFKGSFPARFGGRLSSVIDVRTNDGDMKKFHGSFGIGLLSSKLSLEGPIVKDKTSFNISARRSYIDLLTKPFMPADEKFAYYFYDLNAKINHKFSDRSRLFLSAYHGKDHFSTKYTDTWNSGEMSSTDKSNLDWGNTIVSARWNYIFGNRLFGNMTAAYNNYYLDMDWRGDEQYLPSAGKAKQSQYGTTYQSGIRDLSFLTDFDYNPTPAHHIKFGTGYLYHTFRPEVTTTKVTDREGSVTTQDTTYRNAGGKDIYGHELSAYVEDDWSIGDRLRMNLGLHASLFNVQGKSYHSLQPRLSMRYQATEGIAFKASYTQMSQSVHLLSSSPIAMPTDLWVPVTKKIKPMQSYQYGAGVYYTGIRGWEFSAESYYKDMHNVLEYKDGVSFLGSSSGWEDKVDMGTGRAMGVEFMVQKLTGRTTGWLSYTLAKSDRKFAQGSVNNGERFPYKYDRRHSFNLVVNHRLGKRVELSASWVFFSGSTTTIPQQRTMLIVPGSNADSGSSDYFGNFGEARKPEVTSADYIVRRNNFRLPSSHRLNLSVNFNKKTKRGVRTWNISLYNVYNAMNPAFVYRSSDAGREDKLVIKKLTILPLMPSVSYSYKF